MRHPARFGCIDRTLDENLFRRIGDPTAALKG
jgi:hypothetical protein